jgi:hypothetical protein
LERSNIEWCEAMRALCHPAMPLPWPVSEIGDQELATEATTCHDEDC